MHLLAISLLTILAGTLLLAKFRKDLAGKFFLFISWFFIVVGFVLFIGFIGGGICRMAHHGCDGPKCGHEMMMKECGPGMHHGFCCPPPCMEKGMCCKMMGNMPKDSTMKCCSGKMKCDSVKMQVKK
jgi:hypothetical protein